MKLYLKIKQLRISNGLTQSEFAKIAGVTPATISQYEAGEREPSLKILIKLSKKFNVTIDDLVNKDFKKLRKMKFEAYLGENPLSKEIHNAIDKIVGHTCGELRTLSGVLKKNYEKVSKWEITMKEIPDE